MDTERFELDASSWVNSEPINLEDLLGTVVLIEAFQMLCPGCVSHGIPQAAKVHRTFKRSDVVVIGLHTVFEHHDVMGPDALRAFVSEYRIPFPVAVDRPVAGRSIPSTMGRYQLQGTPTALILDRSGRLRHMFLGAIDDLALGSHLGHLIAEPAEPAPALPTHPATDNPPTMEEQP